MTRKCAIYSRVSTDGHVFTVGEGLLPKDHYLEQGAVWDERARAYWQHSGPGNHLGLISVEPEPDVLDASDLRGDFCFQPHGLGGVGPVRIATPQQP